MVNGEYFNSEYFKIFAIRHSPFTIPIGFIGKYIDFYMYRYNNLALFFCRSYLTRNKFLDYIKLINFEEKNQ
jgi:hypothetical protein